MSNTTILLLPTTIGLTGSEWLEIVQGGVSVRITLSQLAQYVKAMTIPAQVVVAGQQPVTNLAAPLANNALQSGVTVKAAQTNAGAVYVGTSNVNTGADGHGTGYRLDPGSEAFFCVNNTDAIYVIGTNADVVFYEGS